MALFTRQILPILFSVSRHVSRQPTPRLSRVYSSVDGNNAEPRPRVRQHVNPLASAYQEPISLAEGWVSALFQDPSLPFHIDVGCARGTFCMELARARPGMNVLGLEIRRPVAAYCAKNARESNLGNIGFLSCNANVDLGRVLEGVCENSRVERLSIQYPDPHWKARHNKRRVVQPELIQAIADHTGVGSEVFLQSDVLEVAAEMRDRFRHHPGFADQHEDPEEWMQENPTGVPTERELATFKKGLPVFRALLGRVN